jgi:hypothetical protein
MTVAKARRGSNIDAPPAEVSPAEKFSRACAFVCNFGTTYRGKTLARIGSSDAGLRYLDKLRGGDFVKDKPDIKDALETYLEHPQIARMLDAAIGD